MLVVVMSFSMMFFVGCVISIVFGDCWLFVIVLLNYRFVRFCDESVSIWGLFVF